METYRGFDIMYFPPYYFVMKNGGYNYEKEPFFSVREAKAKIDRHLDNGEGFTKEI